MKPLLSVNPSTGSLIKSFDQYSDEHINQLLNRASEIQKELAKH